MPNWCSNRLTVFGTEHALTSFLSAARTEESSFSFQVFVPCPEELKETTSGHTTIDGVSVTVWRNVSQPDGKMLQVRITPEDLDRFKWQYGATNWYDWQIQNWGTKWDVEAHVSSDAIADGEVSIDFETAWSPPKEFVLAVSNKFPALTFTLDYAEPGVGFGGRATYRDGDLVEAVEAEDAASAKHLSEWHSDAIGSIAEDDDDDDEWSEDEEEDEEVTNG
ncbi:hypothetical protein EBZ80_08770 [bacterium]|nr:hypothetical protein [bacterium]